MRRPRRVLYQNDCNKNKKQKTSTRKRTQTRKKKKNDGNYPNPPPSVSYPFPFYTTKDCPFSLAGALSRFFCPSPIHKSSLITVRLAWPRRAQAQLFAHLQIREASGSTTPTVLGQQFTFVRPDKTSRFTASLNPNARAQQTAK